MSKYYPDISHYHPVKDWSKIKNNCPFIITKATQGTSFVDSTLKTVVKECEARGIPYWLYTYLNKGSELSQAKFLVSTCKDIVGDYFVGYVLDVEAGNTAGNVQKAMDYLKSTGYKMMLYTMYAEYAGYRTVIANRPKRCAWWEARYGLNNGSYSSKYPCHSGADLHQFTENGICPGISDKIDLNRVTGQGKKEAWFTKPRNREKKKYSGTFPALPPRGYYQTGDGTKTLTDYTTQIKRVQKVLNWATGAGLTVDGKYGEKTAAVTKKLQKKAGTTQNGKFGDKCLAYVKSLKK